MPSRGLNSSSANVRLDGVALRAQVADDPFGCGTRVQPVLPDVKTGRFQILAEIDHEIVALFPQEPPNDPGFVGVKIRKVPLDVDPFWACADTMDPAPRVGQRQDVRVVERGRPRGGGELPHQAQRALHPGRPVAVNAGDDENPFQAGLEGPVNDAPEGSLEACSADLSEVGQQYVRRSGVRSLQAVLNGRETPHGRVAVIGRVTYPQQRARPQRPWDH